MKNQKKTSYSCQAPHRNVLTILLYAIWSLLFQKVPIKGPGQRHKYASVSNSYKSNPRSRSIKTGVLKNFAKSKGKHLSQSLFFNKVAGVNFIKKETLTVFLWILRNFYKHQKSTCLIIIKLSTSISIQCDSVLLLVYIPM